MINTILTQKTRVYNYLSAIPVKKEISDLRAFLETARTRQNRFVLSAVKKYWPRQIDLHYLTPIRITFGAALLVFLFMLRNDNGIFVAPLFLASAALYFVRQGLTDTFKKETPVAATLNSLTDRLVLLPILFYSLVSYNKTLIFLLVLLEITNAFIRLFTPAGRSAAAQEDIFSISKTSLQYMVMAAVVVFWPQSPNVAFAALLWLSLIFMAISIILKTMAALAHHETAKSQNIQHAFKQEGRAKTA